jgi:DNA-directed RNA polymerase specialized sigma24 family protein
VARWNTDATPEHVEDAFREACARAEHACLGQMEGEVYNWLRTTTRREIARQRRRSQRERVIDVPVDEHTPMCERVDCLRTRDVARSRA